MRRPVRIILLTAAFSMTVGLFGPPSVADGSSWPWQKQLDTARKAQSVHDWDTATAAYAAALELAEDTFGPTDSRIAATLGEISRLSTLQWDKARAIEAQKRAIEILTTTDDPVSAKTVADAYYRLARIHRRFGEANLAEEPFRQALARKVALHGNDHRAVGNVARDLGLAIAEARPQDGEAEELLRRTMTIDETPSNHVHLADYYSDRQQHDRALDELRAAIRLEENRPMPQFGQLVSLWGKLADQYLALKLYDDAESAARTALELREERLGPVHPKLAFSLKKLAAILIAAERLVEAEEQLLRADRLNSTAWGDTEHRCSCDTASLMEELDVAFGRRGNAGRRAGDEIAAAESIEDPLVSRIDDLEKEAEAQKVRGEIQSAIANMRESTGLRGELYGTISLEYAEGLSRLASLLQDQRRYDEAAEVLNERLELLEMHVGPTDPQMMDSLGAMGYLMRMTEDHEASDMYYRRELRARVDAGQNLKAARVLEALGNLNLSSSQAERAAADFSQAAERWGTMVGVDSPEIIYLHSLYARALIDLGRFADAELVLTGLLELEEGQRYPDSRALIRILKTLGTVYERTNQADAAKDIKSRLSQLYQLSRAVNPRDERVRKIEAKRLASRTR